MVAAVILALIFGACAGSFLGVVIHRLPRGVSIVTPPSRCGVCGTRLSAFENVPILGWLLLRGRCRHCGTPIPASCIWMEAVVAAITATITWAALSQGQLWSPGIVDACLPLSLSLGLPPTLLAQGIALAVLLVVTWLLIAAFVIDWELLIIPDEITKGLQVIAIPAAVLVGTNLIWGPGAQRPWALMWWLQRWDRFDGWIATPATAAWRLGLCAGLGIAAILLSLLAARWIYSRFDRDAWSDQDHRALGLGAVWFCAWLALWSALGVILLLAMPPGIVETPWQSNPWFKLHLSLLHAVLGSLVGWGLPWAIGLIGTVAFRRSAMGYADVKLLGALGAFLGPVGVIACFVFATVVGTIVGIPARFFGGGRQVPFGPSLAAGAVLAIAAGPWLAPIAGRLLRVLD